MDGGAERSMLESLEFEIWDADVHVVERRATYHTN